MKILLYLLIVLSLLFALTSCGRIRNDDFNVYTSKTDFGNLMIKIQPSRTGVIFIHFGPPYDLIISADFDNKVRSAKILSLKLQDIEELNTLNSFENLKLSTVPNPGETNIYYSLSEVLTEYIDVRINIELEIILENGDSISYAHIENFIRNPSTRWWSFFELG